MGGNIHSSPVLQSSSQVLHLSICMFCCFVLPLLQFGRKHCTFFFTPPCLFDNLVSSNFADFLLHQSQSDADFYTLEYLYKLSAGQICVTSYRQRIWNQDRWSGTSLWKKDFLVFHKHEPKHTFYVFLPCLTELSKTAWTILILSAVWKESL